MLQQGTFISYKVYMPKLFKRAQDPISSYSHFLGVLIGIIFMFIFVTISINHNNPLHITIGLIIFCLSIMALYGASSYYHYISNNNEHKIIFRKLDHSMIYVLIAGSYTPVCLTFFNSNKAMLFLIIIWGIALGGILMKILWLNAPRILYTSLYLLMGWMVIFDLQSFMQMPINCLYLIALGGVFYSIGAIIYMIKKPNISKDFGFHELFHIFILAGTFTHCISFLLYIV